MRRSSWAEWMFLECCGNYCWFTFVLWGGFCLVLFQSFVICHLLIASVCNTQRLPPEFCLRGKSIWKTRWEVNLYTWSQCKNLAQNPTREPSCRSNWLLPFNALFFLRFNYWYRAHKGTWTLLCMESLPC